MLNKFVFLIFLSLSCVALADASADDRVSLVKNLYKEYAWEAIIEEPDLRTNILMQQPKEVLSRYFSQDLVGLILKDRECVRRTKEICNLNWAPIWGGQDPGAYELKITKAQAWNKVLVKFLYPANGEAITLIYILKKEGDSWRIDDIVDKAGVSLHKQLSLTNEQKNS